MDVVLILAAAVLVVVCGIFVAAEFAFVTLDRPAVERAAKDDRRARGVLAALRSLSTQLSGAQLGITLTNLLIGFLAEPSIASLIEGPLRDVGVPSGAVTGVAVAIGLIVATAVTMVFGELVPKNLAIARPLGTARAVQGFMRGFTRLLGPVIRLLNGMANAILHRLGVEPQEELASARTPQELASLVARSAEQGTLSSETAGLMQRSIAFGGRHAEDVMTPRTRMEALTADAPVLAVIETARRTGFSRFPVLGESADEVLGIVHVKDAVGVPLERRGEVAVVEVMRAPVFVPSSVELDPLLTTLRAGGVQLAVVVDEFGGVDGIVTFEDLVEEIVGEVHDEHDRRMPAFRADGPGRWVLSGLLRPDEATRVVGVAIPESEEYETVAGLLSERLGRVPAVGDRCTLRTRDADGATREVVLSVARMDGLRVDQVAIAVGPPTAGAAGEGEPA